jgi:hypothetical protein
MIRTTVLGELLYEQVPERASSNTTVKSRSTSHNRRLTVGAYVLISGVQPARSKYLHSILLDAIGERKQCGEAAWVADLQEPNVTAENYFI